MSLILLLYGGGGTAAAVPPPDRDDQDAAGNTLTFTDFIDADGAYLRPARLTIHHAMNSKRNAALVGPERLDPDRYFVEAVRNGRTPNTGRTMRIFATSNRAGERSGILRVRVYYTSQTLSRRLTTDTTYRVDDDGAYLRIPTFRAFLAVDDKRNSALSSTGGTDQDRDVAHLSLPASSRNRTARIFIADDGRAGNRTALLRVRVYYEAVGPERVLTRQI